MHQMTAFIEFLLENETNLIEKYFFCWSPSKHEVLHGSTNEVPEIHKIKKREPSI